MEEYKEFKTDIGKIVVSDAPIKIGDKVVFGNVALKNGWNWGIKIIENEEDVEHYTELKELFSSWGETRNKTILSHVLKENNL